MPLHPALLLLLLLLLQLSPRAPLPRWQVAYLSHRLRVQHQVTQKTFLRHTEPGRSLPSRSLVSPPKRRHYQRSIFLRPGAVAVLHSDQGSAGSRATTLRLEETAGTALPALPVKLTSSSASPRMCTYPFPKARSTPSTARSFLSRMSLPSRWWSMTSWTRLWHSRAPLPSFSNRLTVWRSFSSATSSLKRPFSATPSSKQSRSPRPRATP
mmetsp:Transcript_17648/g.56332  ORF Transcript_17648/g.56332 Transcript_17648/m.56332 type:complete len:211 (+) Transcript_17648:644-1276(+)